MPPRYVYWTIIVDGQPTAFRSGSLEDIMPTFNRLKEKQPSAELKWFQNGQLWASRHDAQDFMRARGERGRSKDPRQSKSDGPDAASGFPVRRSFGEGGSRTDKPERAWNAKPDWKTRSTFKPRAERDPGSGTRDTGIRGARSNDKPSWVPKDKSTFRPDPGSRVPDPGKSGKPEWKPKGTFKPREAGHASGWGEKPSFAPRSSGASTFAKAPADKSARPAASKSGERPAWKPKGTFKPREEGHRPSTYAKATVRKSARDQARSSFKPKPYTPKVDDGRTRSSRVQSRNDKLEWAPKSSSRPEGPNSGFRKSKGDVASGFSRSQSEGQDRPEGKRKWVPKAEYKKSLGIEAKKDSKWRPGGDHVDPKQKYKDAKKAKWTKFKANIRARSTKPRGDK